MKKIPKIILSIFCIITTLFILGFAILPTWISTPSGTQTALKLINKRINGQLSIDKLRLNWLGAQKIDHLKYSNEQGDSVLSFSKFETNTSLLYLILGGRSFKKTQLDTPFLKYTQKIHEESEKPEIKKNGKTKTRKWISFKDALTISNGTVVFASKTVPLITVSDIFVNKQPSSERLVIRASTVQGKSNGSLNIDAVLTNPLKAHILLKDFPIAILDQVEQTTLFSEALGPQLSADLKAEKKRGRVFNNQWICSKCKSKRLFIWIY